MGALSSMATRSRIGDLRLPPPWLLALLFLNVPLIFFGLLWLVAFPADWELLEQVAARLEAGTLYEHTATYNWVWSPIAAWLVAVLVVPMGYWVLFALKVAVLPLLGWRLALLTALSIPFWVDAVQGNLFALPAVAGVLAIRGNQWGALAFLALTCLMPRPVQLPLAAWLVWKQPRLRLPLLGMLGVSAAAVVASGYLGEWVAVLMSLAGSYGTPEVNIGPTRLLGVVWLLIGVPLAAVLTIRGHVGWAGLALSPYVIPQYLLVMLWEMARSQSSPAQPNRRERDGLTDSAQPDRIGETAPRPGGA